MFVKQIAILASTTTAAVASAVPLERRGESTCTFTIVGNKAPTPNPNSLQAEFGWRTSIL